MYASACVRVRPLRCQSRGETGGPGAASSPGCRKNGHRDYRTRGRRRSDSADSGGVGRREEEEEGPKLKIKSQIKRPDFWGEGGESKNGHEEGEEGEEGRAGRCEREEDKGL